MSDLLIIVPAYNEAGNIARGMDRLRRDFPEFGVPRISAIMS